MTRLNPDKEWWTAAELADALPLRRGRAPAGARGGQPAVQLVELPLAPGELPERAVRNVPHRVVVRDQDVQVGVVQVLVALHDPVDVLALFGCI